MSGGAAIRTPILPISTVARARLSSRVTTLRPSGPHHLLVDDRLAHDVRALAAVLARPAEREVARLRDLALPGAGLGDAPRVAPLEGPRIALLLRDVPPEPGAHGAAKHLLL